MNKKYILIFLITLVIFIGACKTAEQQVNQPKGTLLLKITDHAVDDYNKVLITISTIEINKDGNWTTFSDEEKTFDLIKLENIADILGEKQLDVGKYTQIRLLVTKSSVELKDGTTANVKVPSEKIKLVNEFDISEGQITELILDFDPDSVKKAGSQYLMTPTIKVLTLDEFDAKVEESKKVKIEPPKINLPEQAIKEFTVAADDSSLNPKTLTLNKGDLVKITFDVSKNNVYYGGLDFRSKFFDTGTILPGNSKEVEFTATESFTYTSYWPKSGAVKTSGDIIVNQ